jgi:hypothetical protein
MQQLLSFGMYQLQIWQSRSDVHFQVLKNNNLIQKDKKGKSM